jgi:hypothetical protein
VRPKSAGEEKLFRLPARHAEKVIDRLARLLSQLELDGMAGLVLSDGHPVNSIAVRCDVVDLMANIAAHLLSKARLNTARSRTCPSIWNLVRISQYVLRS